MKCSGMTLLELLVAMTIFSLVAIAGYISVDQSTSVIARLEQEQKFWSRLESVYVLIGADLDQAIRKAPRSPAGQDVAFRGYPGQRGGRHVPLFSFSRAGPPSFSPIPVNPLQRITYSLEGNVLYRSAGPLVDAALIDEINNEAVLAGLSAVRMRYLLFADDWRSQWPQTLNPGDPTVLPRAVEIVLEFENQSSYVWVFHAGTPR